MTNEEIIAYQADMKAFRETKVGGAFLRFEATRAEVIAAIKELQEKAKNE